MLGFSLQLQLLGDKNFFFLKQAGRQAGGQAGGQAEAAGRLSKLALSRATEELVRPTDYITSD